MTGRIIGIGGPTVTIDTPQLTLYERVLVGEEQLAGEVVRLARGRAEVQIYEDPRGLGVGEPAAGTGEPLTVRLGPGLLGGLFDGLQRPLAVLREQQGPFLGRGAAPFPLDRQRRWRFVPQRRPGDEVAAGAVLGEVREGGFRHPIGCAVAGTLAEIEPGEFAIDEPIGRLADGTPLFLWSPWPARTPRPVRRKLPPQRPLVTGQRSLDFLFPLAMGGTAIFPGGFGTGKTVLEQSLAKYAAVDVVVYVGCGERGNEMAELIEELAALRDPRRDEALLARTVVVANTSNMPVAAREASIYTAVTLAEYYRDMGLHVLLLADSLSRWAEALREISTSLEEMPGEEGYPTYLGSRLAAFFERAGAVETLAGETGSLTMVLAISPPGGDITEPVSQACLRAAGAFYMLDTRLAHARHFPAVHWGQSYSLYGSALESYFTDSVCPDWRELVGRCREILRREEELREVVEVIGLEGLQDADRLLMTVAERLRREFLCQSAFTEDANCPPEQTATLMRELTAFFDRSAARLAQGELLDDILRQER